jgi:hypothetical protein
MANRISAVLRGEAEAIKQKALRAFVRGGLVSFVVLAAWFLWVVFRGPQSGGSVVINAAVALGFAVFYGAALGLAAAVAVIAWHLFGAWLLLPIVLVPGFIWLSFSLGNGVAVGLLHDLLTAAGTAAQHALASSHMLEGLRVGHAGGPAALLLLVVLLPYLALLLLKVLFAPAVLWVIIKLSAWLAFLLLAGLTAAAIISAPLLTFGMVRRVRKRAPT